MFSKFPETKVVISLDYGSDIEDFYVHPEFSYHTFSFPKICYYSVDFLSEEDVPSIKYAFLSQVIPGLGRVLLNDVCLYSITISLYRPPSLSSGLYPYHEERFSLQSLPITNFRVRSNPYTGNTCINTLHLHVKENILWRGFEYPHGRVLRFHYAADLACVRFQNEWLSEALDDISLSLTSPLLFVSKDYQKTLLPSIQLVYDKYFYSIADQVRKGYFDENSSKNWLFYRTMVE